MGYPKTLSVCSNGHIVAQNPHDCFTPMPKKCWCGSTTFYTQYEEENLVPFRWLYYGWRWDNRRNKMIKFFVYDIEKLKKNQENKKGE